MLCFALSVIPLLLALEDGVPLWEKMQRLTWKNRVVVIYAPKDDSEKMRQQRKNLALHPTGIKERDLVVIECIGTDLTQEDSNYIERHFNHNLSAFGVWLVGKDGSTKLTSLRPVTTDTVFELIDSMPMRQSELKNRP